MTISASVYTVFDGQTTNLQGTITNHGAILLDSTVSSAILNASGSVMLTGGGEIAMAGLSDNRIAGGSADTLTNVYNTIKGIGQIH